MISMRRMQNQIVLWHVRGRLQNDLLDAFFARQFYLFSLQYNTIQYNTMLKVFNIWYELISHFPSLAEHKYINYVYIYLQSFHL